MLRKYKLFGIIVPIFLLWLAIYAGVVCAEIRLGGIIETNLITTVSPDGEVTVDWLEHLNLEFLLPRYDQTSARLEVDLYYDPQGKIFALNEESGLSGFNLSVSKLYFKHRFDKFHLTLGRQPITWSLSSILNPVDFSISSDLMGMTGGNTSENAVRAYIPLNWSSNLTVIAAFPEGRNATKWGLRGRTNFHGFDLTMNYVNEPESLLTLIPYKQRLGFTAKGDVGPIAVYGALGYNFDEDFADGKPTYLVGTDYSFDLEYGSKLVAQLEYLRDEAQLVQNEMIFGPIGPDLLIGMLSYEIDEFAAAGLVSIFNLKDHSLMLGPEYHNMIGSSVDLSIRGGIFLGEERFQFGPNEILGIPQAMVQMSVSYPF
ncbi:MAG: hypothetical protein KAX49_05705 [Halanaerobiales bacterium]|nr:hypothetical protein [Halanaerobiales bacterium]